jgi:hypothetical protein
LEAPAFFDGALSFERGIHSNATDAVRPEFVAVLARF